MFIIFQIYVGQFLYRRKSATSVRHSNAIDCFKNLFFANNMYYKYMMQIARTHIL